MRDAIHVISDIFFDPISKKVHGDARLAPRVMTEEASEADRKFWLDAAAATGLRGFSAGPRQHLDAVRAAITLP